MPSADLLIAAALPAKGQQAAAGPAEEVLIVGKRLNRTSKGATNLPMSLADMPQAVSVIERELIDSFGFDDVNEVLKLTTGVNVQGGPMKRRRNCGAPRPLLTLTKRHRRGRHDGR